MNTTNTNVSDKGFVNLKHFAEQRITQTPISYERVEVTVNLDSQVLTTYKTELFSEWNAAARFVGRELPFTSEELSRYLDALVQLRVDYVNGHRVPFMPTDGLSVPSFLSLVLSNLGLAREPTQGIELYPVMGRKVEIDYDFMLKISRGIRVCSNLGIEFAEGYLRSRDGSFDFMSMTLLDAYVRTWTRDTHPVYALLASTLAIRGIETVLSPRINYGNVQHFSSLVRHLATVKG